ncbi:DUF4244 domain-containing protein [Paenarthrobacter sp. NPDC091669]|uniref:DUF4244 domain-containing protein n=1 Tax=Paenarthrobacter sp. NPDC091669 TaxID=3364384 RepID=UPI0037F212D5
MRTLFRAESGRRQERRAAGQDRAAVTGKQGMRTFGIEQFELEEFTDSGFGEAGRREAGTDLQPTTSHGALAVRNPEGLRDQSTLRRRPRRLHRKKLWMHHERLRTRGMLPGSESGMATAEYAIATLAAVGLAGLLVVLLRSEEVRGFLLNLIRTALSLP